MRDEFYGLISPKSKVAAFLMKVPQELENNCQPQVHASQGTVPPGRIDIIFLKLSKGERPGNKMTKRITKSQEKEKLT